MQAIAICGCLCLLAVGAGVTYLAFDREPVQMAEIVEENQPVTVVQTPPLEVAVLERDKMSQDDGKSPDLVEEKQPEAKKQTAEPVFAYPVQGEARRSFRVTPDGDCL